MRDTSAGDARIAVVASWAIVLVILVQGTLSMLTQVSDELGTAQRVAGVVSGLAGAALFLVVQRRTLRDRPVPPVLVGATVVCATGAFLAAAWLNAALVLALVGLRLTGRRLVLAGGAYALGITAFMLEQGVNPYLAFFLLVVLVAVGLLLYVMTRLAVTVGELARARETVARLRVDEERHRISRDLHDILGRSLVAVGLRVQTAIRLLDRDPQRCGEQLDEVARMVTDGQSRLRALTRGQTVTGFDDELAAALDLFERLGIRATADVDPAAASREGTDRLGPRVLREAVTTLLKHARPSWVEIGLRREATADVLVVVNDGAAESDRPRGTGLADLAARAEAVDGSLEAGHVPGGRFRVICRMPTLLGDGSDDADLVRSLP